MENIEAFDNCINAVPKKVRRDYSLYINPKDKESYCPDIFSYRGHIIRTNSLIQQDKIYFTEAL